MLVSHTQKSYPKLAAKAWELLEAELAKMRVAEKERYFAFPVHSHMLCHSCGYKLANDGHDTRAIQAWLGHANINTL